MLPTLTVNRSFMRAFIGADTPCFALGMVEEHGRPCGLLALRPDEEIPAAVSDVGFNFGHSLFGSADFAVIHFAFAFYGYQTYNVLINPNNPLVQTVLNKMIADGDCERGEDDQVSIQRGKTEHTSYEITGQGPVLVLIHGVGLDSAMWATYKIPNAIFQRRFPPEARGWHRSSRRKAQSLAALQGRCWGLRQTPKIMNESQRFNRLECE